MSIINDCMTNIQNASALESTLNTEEIADCTNVLQGLDKLHANFKISNDAMKLAVSVLATELGVQSEDIAEIFGSGVRVLEDMLGQAVKVSLNNPST